MSLDLLQYYKISLLYFKFNINRESIGNPEYMCFKNAYDLAKKCTGGEPYR